MKLKPLLAGLAGAALLWSGQAGAAVLLSDNFDSESQSLNYTGFANWNVTAGSVDLIGTNFYDFYPGNGNYVDMNGSTGQAGAITSQQVFSIGAGETLSLNFDLGGSTRGTTNTVEVWLGAMSLASYTLLSSDPLVQYSLSFLNSTSAAFSGALSFRSLSVSDQGAILDNVLVSSTGTDVPEPATLALLGLGLGGLVLRRRRQG